MSPRHFSRLTKNPKISETERLAEEKVEEALRHTMWIIATPLRAIKNHNNNRPDKG